MIKKKYTNLVDLLMDHCDYFEEKYLYMEKVAEGVECDLGSRYKEPAYIKGHNGESLKIKVNFKEKEPDWSLEYSFDDEEIEKFDSQYTKWLDSAEYFIEK